MTGSVRLKVVLSIEARRDLRETLEWSELQFGRKAAKRYHAIILQALDDIGMQAFCLGSKNRDDLLPGVRVYHLRSSRNRIQTATGIVKNPRHFLLYRPREGGASTDVLCILYDGRDLKRHISDE